MIATICINYIPIVFFVELFVNSFSIDSVGANIVEMAYSSNILAVVGNEEKDAFSPLKLTIWATDTNSALCERAFLFKVEAVKLNKSRYFSYKNFWQKYYRLVVCVKDKIHIFNMANIKFVHSLDVNFSLTRFALSPSSDNCFLVYSDNIEYGKVLVYDAHNLVPKQVIEAHKTPVLKLSINFSGTMLATCSVKVIF